MSRWRDTKKGNIQKPLTNEKSLKDDSLVSAPLPNRIKSFIVDMFMIMMPIMYITTYLIMDGKDDFQGSEDARWITTVIYGAIIIFFWTIKGQTPGYKAYELKLIDNNTKENISLIKSITRYLIYIFCAITIILAFIPFFRKDKKTLQDILTKTTVIKEK